MYAVTRRRPSDLKSRSNSMIRRGVRLSSFFLALFDRFLRFCSFGQVPAIMSNRGSRVSTECKTTRCEGPVRVHCVAGERPLPRAEVSTRQCQSKPNKKSLLRPFSARVWMLRLSMSQNSRISPSFDWQCMTRPNWPFSGLEGAANLFEGPPDSRRSAAYNVRSFSRTCLWRSSRSYVSGGVPRKKVCLAFSAKR